MTSARTLLRYIRFATTVSCLILGSLLIVSGVRSYWWRDAVYGRFSTEQWFHVISMEGQVTFAQFKAPNELNRFAHISKDSVFNLRVPDALEIPQVRRFGLYTGQVRSERMNEEWQRMQRQLKSMRPSQPPKPAFFGFGFHRHPRGIELDLPHWFLAFASGTLAVAPWIKWRFSLRTLLIGITVMAVVLGIAIM